MDCYEWLSKLIAFDTTSRNSNLNLITAIQDHFDVHGIKTRLTYDADRQKANLFASLPNSKGDTSGGLVLSGHTDVVPVDGQQWDSDPFHAKQTPDRIIGRGACDMKGFLAVVLALLPQLQKLKRSHAIHFAFSYDEEVGCLGARSLIADFQEANIQPTACLVGEPTNMRPVVAHKGIQGFRCKMHGRAAHSSLVTQGCNAIEHAAQFIFWLRQLSMELREKGAHDACYDVPFTTLTTNMIQGGNALNIIPAFCEFLFEFRNLPALNPQTLSHQIEHYLQKELLPLMKKEYSDARIEIDAMGTVPGLDASEEANITKIVRNLTNDRTIYKVSYATEAGLFQQAGIQTLVCGPGSIEQAHRANEYVMKEQLDRCEEFLLNLVQAY